MPSPFVEAVKDFAPQTAFRSVIRKFFFPRSHIELQFAVDAATAERSGLKYEDQFYRSDWFEAVSLFAIFVNAIVLANADPLHPDSAINKLIDYVDAIMTFFFLAELLLRVVCFGMTIFEADAWFVVDLVVVIAGLLSWVLSFVSDGSSLSLSALRAIRLLRPLRSIRVITSVRLFLAALIEAVTELTDVLILLLIFILILSVAGVSQYNSRLRFHCIGSDYQHPIVRNRTGINDVNDFMPYSKYEVVRQEIFRPVYNMILRDRVPMEDIRYQISNGTFAGTPLMLQMLATPGCFEYFPFVPCSKLVAWPPEGDPKGISWNYTAEKFTNYSAMKANNFSQPVFLNLSAVNESVPGVNESLPFLHMMRMCYADRPSTSDTMSVTFSHEITHSQSRTISLVNGTTTTKATTTKLTLTTIYNFSSTTTTTKPMTTTVTSSLVTTPPPTPALGGRPVVFKPFDEKPYKLFRRFLRCWGTYQDPYEYESIIIYKGRKVIQDWWYGIWEFQTCSNVSAIVFQGYNCPFGYDCRVSGNPYFGLVGFDNLVQAALTVFICVTLESYGDLASQLADAVDSTAIFYFIIIVLFGSFFIVNLAVAQMTVAFAAAAEAEADKVLTEAKTLDKREISKVEVVLQRIHVWVEAQRKAEYVPIRENDNIAEGDAQAMKELTALIAQRKRHEREREKLKARIALELAAGGARARELFAENLEEVGVAKVFLSIWQKRRRNTRNFLYNRWMQYLVISMIVLNLCQLASEFYGMPQLMVDIYEWLGLGFTCFFTVEFALRIFAIGPVTVMTRSFADWIDFLVIVMSWLSIAVAALNFPMVRTFRVLRIFVLMQNSPTLQKWIMVIASSARQMTVLFFVTCAAIFILSCVAVQIFGAQLCNLGTDDDRPDNSFPPCPFRPRANFDALSTAMLVNFQIMTGDNWSTVMFDGMRALGNPAALYFVLWYCVGNLVLANVVIAILVVAMGDAVADSKRQAEELKKIRQEYEDPDAAAVLTDADKIKKAKEEKVRVQREQLEERKSRNDLQQQVVDLTQTQAYERAYIGLLIISCICTAMERPRDAPDETAATLFSNVEFVSQIFFFVDVVLKMFAYGFIKTKYSYLRRSGWFVFDFIVMACTGLGALLAYFNLGLSNTVQILRVGRALRPLRLIAYSSGMLGVVQTLRDALVPMRSLLVIVMSGFVVWGVIGVQLYAGSFYSCSLPAFTNRTACEQHSGAWLNSERHFDNLGAAMKTLFTVVSLDNWVSIQWNCVDAVGPDQSFRVGYNSWGAFYPISFVVVGSFFLLNLFVSVLIDTYQLQKSSEGRTPFVTESQAGWIKTQSTVVGLVPLVDYDDDVEQVDGNPAYIFFRKQVRNVVRHPLADVLVYCFIAVNFLVMASDRFPKSDTSATVVSLTNALFTLIFTLECVLKMIAEGMNRYFSSKWNTFDFFVVLFSLLGIAVEYAMSSTTIASAFRTLRVLRLFRLLRKSRRLQVVIKKFAFALLSLKNISALIGLFFLTFAIIGVKIFGRIAEGPDFRRRSTFANLQNAMTMLLRAVTAENWTLHMIHCSITQQTGLCDDHLGNCGAFGFAEAYYITFVTIGAYIFLNLFIAVVLDAYSNARHVDSDAFTEWEGGQLLQLWLRFDPEMKFRMHSRFLVTFLRSIPPSCALSWGELPVRRRLQHEVVAVDALAVKELSGLVELQDIITALCRIAFHSELPEERRRSLQKKANTRFRTDDRNRDRPDEKTLIPSVQRFAVMIIEAYFLRRYEVLERRRHYEEVRLRKQKQNRVLAHTFGIALANHGLDDDDDSTSNGTRSREPSSDPQKNSSSSNNNNNNGRGSVNNNNNNDNDDGSGGGGGGADNNNINGSRSQSENVDGKFELPPEAKAAHAKLQAAVKKAKEQEIQAARFRRYDAQGWLKTEDADKKAEPGKTVASTTYRAAGVPLERQSRIQQIEASIGSRSVGREDLWADVTDLIGGGGDGNLVALGNAILKKQQAHREAEERERAKKMEEERQQLATKQSELSFEDIAKMLMPNYSKARTYKRGMTLSDEDRMKQEMKELRPLQSGGAARSSSEDSAAAENISDFLGMVPPPSAPKKPSKYAGDADFDLL